ncbi:hypothetical protein [Rhodobacter ferrooxidans]|uniref:Uncharacterized protein n=1 Tax=Rhodobacter ferrooxidans TaxID=371731 RepID=C8RYS3_9RHOB|nr:hypothetical protein [Rhodobacter sp. SW2]EEW26261.1 conserved hypothetical protein [Rhodobacter sp. SW2]
MLEFLPKEVREGLAAAREQDRRRKERLRVEYDGADYPVLAFRKDHFTLSADQLPHLRGLVDVYDGANHVFQCLIVASTVEDGELVCDFKRLSPISDKAALDFAREDDAPVALLTKM